MKVLESYSHIKGFNHEPVFTTYTQEIMEKELSYAKRLGLNSCRLFMPIRFWEEDKDGFLKKLQSFVRTAYDKYGITTTPILLMPYFTKGQTPYWIGEDELPEIPGCYYEENYNIGEEYVTAVVNLLKDEPGLLFWDLLEAAEVIVNLLETGEAVPMAYPPSAKLLKYRRQENPDEQEIREWAYSLVKTLEEVCQIV